MVASNTSQEEVGASLLSLASCGNAVGISKTSVKGGRPSDFE